jgi:hypothetical protein
MRQAKEEARDFLRLPFIEAYVVSVGTRRAAARFTQVRIGDRMPSDLTETLERDALYAFYRDLTPLAQEAVIEELTLVWGDMTSEMDKENKHPA